MSTSPKNDAKTKGLISNKESLIQAMLDYLLKHFESKITQKSDAGRVSLKDFPSLYEKICRNHIHNGSADRSQHFYGTAIKWSRGKVLRVGRAGSEQLKEFFKYLVPDFEWDASLFRLDSIEAFKQRIEELSHQELDYSRVDIGIPANAIEFGETNGMLKQLSGLFVTYRCAFTNVGNPDEFYIRELLHVYEEGHFIKFKHYNYTNEKDVFGFSGSVVPIGDTILMVGSAWGKSVRPRVILIGREAFNPLLNQFRIGLLASVILHQSKPCAAKVLMMRIDPASNYKNEEDIEQLAKKLICEREEIVDEDFFVKKEDGKINERETKKIIKLIKGSISNAPRVHQFEGVKLHTDLTMNLYTQEFNNVMGGIELHKNWHPPFLDHS